MNNDESFIILIQNKQSLPQFTSVIGFCAFIYIYEAIEATESNN